MPNVRWIRQASSLKGHSGHVVSCCDRMIIFSSLVYNRDQAVADFMKEHPCYD